MSEFWLLEVPSEEVSVLAESVLPLLDVSEVAVLSVLAALAVLSVLLASAVLSELLASAVLSVLLESAVLSVWLLEAVSGKYCAAAPLALILHFMLRVFSSA